MKPTFLCAPILIISLTFCSKPGTDTGNVTPTTTTPTVTDTTPPTAGATISFSNIADTTLTVNWGAATDATTSQSDIQYRLVKALASTAIDTIAEVDAISGADLLQEYAANDLTQNVTGLTGNTTYFFAVVARDSAGNKVLYSLASQLTATPDVTAPAPGSAISFTSVASTSLTVNWGAATDVVTAQANLQYRLVKASTSTAIDTIAEVDAISGGDLLQDYAANDVTQNVTGLTASTTYFFAVVVRDVAGNKAIYTPASQATSAAPDVTPPTAGAGISFASVADTTLTVNWGAATDAVTAQANLQYRLVKASSSTAIDTIVEIDAISGGDLLQDYTANDVTQNISGLLAGTTYYFAVVVRDVAGNKAIYAPTSQTTTGVQDTTAPTVVSSTPDHAVTGVATCSGNPCTAKIIVVFGESMNTSLSQTITSEIWNGASYMATSSTNTTAAWSTTTNTNDTITINMSWIWFPENTRVRYTLAAAGLQDIAGNSIAAQVQRYFTTTTALQSFAASDTGLTGCYDSSSAQTCPYALFPSQDGNFTNIPLARSFTGPTQYLATTDYTTTDNVTGLVWRSCTEGQTPGAACSGGATTMTWYAAMNQCSALNLMNSGAGYAGRTTWHLPTAAELDTLPNYGVNNPAINTANFPATVSNNYWTASTSGNSGDMSNAFFNNFATGRGNLAAKTTSYYVRCVSSPTIVPIAYTDNGDGTVTDTITSLRWQKCMMGQNNDATCTGSNSSTATWQSSLNYCESLNLGTFGNSSNWRLPSITELKSLVDKSRLWGFKAESLFPSAGIGSYWSSSTYSGSLFNAWNVTFTNGGLSAGDAIGSVKTSSMSVRCVSTGP